MIFDKVENLSRYSSLFAGSEAVVRFIAQAMTETPAPGRYELDGKKVCVGIQEYAPRGFDPDKLEYHRKYIDIQLVLAGREEFYYAPLDGLATVMEYTPEKDCGLARIPAPEAGTKFTLERGNFVLVFPEEGHLPCVGDPASHVVKAVVKIAVE